MLPTGMRSLCQDPMDQLPLGHALHHPVMSSSISWILAVGMGSCPASTCSACTLTHPLCPVLVRQPAASLGNVPSVLKSPLCFTLWLHSSPDSHSLASSKHLSWAEELPGWSPALGCLPLEVSGKPACPRGSHSGGRGRRGYVFAQCRRATAVCLACRTYDPGWC